jgi:RimJ/RimL family protein N-acetyltransferase
MKFHPPTEESSTMKSPFELDLQPTFVGKHLWMRPLESSDFGHLSAVASDPLIWSQHPDPARGTKDGFPLFFENALQSKGCLVAVDRVLRSIIGLSRYSNYIPHQKITVGYTFLARSSWGGLINAEMKRLMLRHAFTDVPEVHFTVAEHNLRSRRAVEKLGAELTGVEDTPRWEQFHLIYRLTFALWARGAAPGYGPEAAQ